jgi:hypothetical protein
MQRTALRFLAAGHPLVPWLIGLACLLAVSAGALPYAGCWNDGSRLATVESILDRHTLTLDESIFCRPPADSISRGCPAYPMHEPDLLANGTRDKLFIRGHFYSDKPAVPSLLMAGLYGAGEWLGLPGPAERPDVFCRVLTIATSGLAYVFAVLSLYQLGGVIALPGGTRLGWVASFALSTVALTYTRHVNNHIMLLGVIAALCLQAAHLAREAGGGTLPWGRLLALGTLAGLGYNLDLGAGPLLVTGLLGLVAYRCRSVSAAAVFLLAGAPWLAAGLAVNYGIGGVWKPMNMVPEYSDWPGGPFSPENLTGFWRHGPLKLPVYTLALLFGKHGFVTHNPPLLLAIPALAILLRPSRYRPELACALGWCGATWLLYAFLSNNYGGACCSIRWFVPFLAPGYFLLAVYLRERPQCVPDFLVLSVWGAVLAAALWVQGPWSPHVSPLLWPVVGAALLSWVVCRWRRAAKRAPTAEPAGQSLAA